MAEAERPQVKRPWDRPGGRWIEKPAWRAPAVDWGPFLYGGGLARVVSEGHPLEGRRVRLRALRRAGANLVADFDAPAGERAAVLRSEGDELRPLGMLRFTLPASALAPLDGRRAAGLCLRANDRGLLVGGLGP